MGARTSGNRRKEGYKFKINKIRTFLRTFLQDRANGKQGLLRLKRCSLWKDTLGLMQSWIFMVDQWGRGRRKYYN